VTWILRLLSKLLVIIFLTIQKFGVNMLAHQGYKYQKYNKAIMRYYNFKIFFFNLIAIYCNLFMS